jgi:molybdate/tungstate transport system substrate-binding protein
VKKFVLVSAIIVVILFTGGLALKITEKTALKVFHAGSLTTPLEEIEREFESEHNVDVQLEPSGSVEAIKKITELHKGADIVAVADYSLIPKMMVPEYADWYIQFARNQMVIAYTDGSKYASEIDNQNWYEILGRSDVKFGFSDPNSDPCGYRAVMVSQLAELYYGNQTIFNNLIENNTSIRANFESGTYVIKAPEDLAPNTGKVRITSMEIELISALQLGTIDYFFIYRSVAVQQGFKFLELPPQIDLSRVKYENVYKNVEVRLSTGKIVTAKPIVYGITIPKNVQHTDLAIDFVKFIISKTGQGIFKNLGQPPVVPAVASDVNKIPEELRPLVSS